MSCKRTLAVALVASALAAATAIFATRGTRATGPSQAPVGPAYEVVVVPTQAGPTEETKLLLETPHLKLVAISLPKDSEPMLQQAPTPITLQAVAGSGVVTLAGATEKVAAGRLLYIAAGMQYEIAVAEGTELVLLVHQLKSPAERREDQR